MKENISPEEKLLRLIRGKKSDNPLALKISHQAAGIKPQAKKNALPKSFGSFSVYNIKISAWWLFGISCAYLVFVFIYPLLGYRQLKPKGPSDEEALFLKPEAKPQIKPFESYEQAISGRNIFSNPIEQQEAQKPLNSPISADLIKDIKLIGIVSGDNPQAVIEDKKTQSTYYLNIGQSFGEFQLEEILDGKVVLNYKGQKYELYL